MHNPVKLLDLFAQSRWDKVWPRFSELYPDQAASLSDYERVYWNLLSLPSVESSLRIVVEYVPGEAGGEGWWDVSGRDETDGESYAIEFRPWDEWLGMEIAPETLTALSPLDILCHCLWELTFIGYDQEEIQAQWQEIEQTVDEIKRADPSQFRPWRELFDEFDLPGDDHVPPD